MMSAATSSAALACAPIEAVPPDIGMITPILTTLSWACAPEANASDIAAAQSSPVTCFKFMKSDLPKGFPDQGFLEALGWRPLPFDYAWLKLGWHDNRTAARCNGLAQCRIGRQRMRRRGRCSIWRRLVRARQPGRPRRVD